jgi:cardiolipin synthase A/B
VTFHAHTSVRLQAADDLVTRLLRLAQQPAVTPQDIALPLGPTSANSVEVLIDGANFFPSILAAVDAAQHSLHIIQFGYRPGAVGDAVTDMLCAKARTGIAVRIIVDAMGSALKEDGVRRMYNRLVDSGVQLVIHNPAALFPREGVVGTARPRRANWHGFARVDHRKLFLIDGRAAFIGGAGIEDHFSNGEYHDAYVRCSGELVQQLQFVFLASFLQRRGAIPASDVALRGYFPPPRPTPRCVAARVLHNVPAAGFYPITEATFAEIRAARRTLAIMNPYLTDRAVIEALVGAAGRQVKVRLILPAKADKPVVGGAMRHYYSRMIDAGIEIWEFPAVAHAKVLVRDNESVMIGSLNLDALSLHHNPELQLQLEDRATAAMLTQELFVRDIRQCRQGVPDRDVATCAWNATMTLFSPFL